LNEEYYESSINGISDPIIKEAQRALIGLANERELVLVNNGCNDMATYKKLTGWLVGAKKCLGYVDGNKSITPAEFAKFVEEDAFKVRSEIIDGGCGDMDAYKGKAGEVEAYLVAARIVENLILRAQEDND